MRWLLNEYRRTPRARARYRLRVAQQQRQLHAKRSYSGGIIGGIKRANAARVKPTPPPKTTSMTDELASLAQLHGSDALINEEFVAAKAKLLS